MRGSNFLLICSPSSCPSPEGRRDFLSSIMTREVFILVRTYEDAKPTGSKELIFPNNSSSW